VAAHLGRDRRGKQGIDAHDEVVLVAQWQRSAAAAAAAAAGGGAAAVAPVGGALGLTGVPLPACRPDAPAPAPTLGVAATAVAPGGGPRRPSPRTAAVASPDSRGALSGGSTPFPEHAAEQRLVNGSAKVPMFMGPCVCLVPSPWQPTTPTTRLPITKSPTTGHPAPPRLPRTPDHKPPRCRPPHKHRFILSRST